MSQAQRNVQDLQRKIYIKENLIWLPSIDQKMRKMDWNIVTRLGYQEQWLKSMATMYRMNFKAAKGIDNKLHIHTSKVKVTKVGTAGTCRLLVIHQEGRQQRHHCKVEVCARRMRSWPEHHWLRKADIDSGTGGRCILVDMASLLAACGCVICAGSGL